MVVAGGRAGVDEAHVTFAEWRSHGSLSSPFSRPSASSYRHMGHQFVDDDQFDMVLSVSSLYISLSFTLALLDGSRSAQAGLRFIC